MAPMSKYLGAAVLGLVGVVSAGPVALESRAISPTILDQLEFFSQYSAAAYCLHNNNSPNTKILCPQGNCARIEAAETNTLTEFENSIASDVTGFVATDTTNKLIVISFRGSVSIRNWITNLVFPVIPTDICFNCTASIGFWNSWMEAEKGVKTALTLAKAQYPDFKVVATGHSLGGALATLAAAALRSEGMVVDLYTYGAPKVGLPNLANFISDTSRGNTYRVTKKDDPVPRLPPALLAYRHSTPEYYLTNANEVLPTVNDVAVYNGKVDLRGNEGNLGFDFEAHRHYFGPTSACEGKEGTEFK